MKSADEIINTDCPYTREIYANGYDEIIKDVVNNNITLLELEGEKKIKTFSIYEFEQLLVLLTVKSGISSIPFEFNYKGDKPHRWISEADGSAEKFRAFINP